MISDGNAGRFLLREYRRPESKNEIHFDLRVFDSIGIFWHVTGCEERAIRSLPSQALPRDLRFTEIFVASTLRKFRPCHGLHKVAVSAIVNAQDTSVLANQHVPINSQHILSDATHENDSAQGDATDQ
jgi:hypothetical protein